MKRGGGNQGSFPVIWVTEDDGSGRDGDSKADERRQ